MKLNKIILFFLALVTLLVAATWKFIESEKFADIVSKEMAKKFFSKKNLELNFSRIEIKVFPLGTVLHEVALNTKSANGPLVVAELGALEINFSFLDFFSSKVNISNVSFRDGAITISDESLPYISQLILENQKSKDDKTPVNIPFKEIIKTYQDKVYYGLPFRINALTFETIDFIYNNSFAHFKFLEIGLYKNFLDAEITLESLRIDHEKKRTTDNVLDSLDMSARLSEEGLDVKSLEIWNAFSKYAYKGKVASKTDKLYLDGSLALFGKIDDIQNLPLGPIVEHLKKLEIDSFFNFDIRVLGLVTDPDIEGHIRFIELTSPFGNFDSINLGVIFKQNSLDVTTLDIQAGQGSIQLMEKLNIGKLDKLPGDLIGKKIKFKAENFYTNDALYYVRDDIEAIKGYVTGVIEVTPQSKGVLVETAAPTYVKNFKLQFSPGQKPVLSTDQINISRLAIDVIGDGNVGIDAGIILSNGLLEASGKVGRDGVKIYSKGKTKVNLEEIGKISEILLKGVGESEFSVTGKGTNVILNFDLGLDNFSIVDFNTGKTEAEISYNIANSRLDIKNIVGSHNQSEFDGSGFFDFKNEPKMQLGINFFNLTYKDSFFFFNPLLKDLKFLPTDLNFLYSTKLTVSGPLDTKKLLVKGEAQGDEIIYWGHSVDKFDLDYEFKDYALSIKNIVLRKNAGFANGSFNVDLNTGNWKYDARIDDLRFSDFEFYKNLRLGYDGDFTGDFRGSIVKNKFTGKSTVTIDNAQIAEVPAGSSVIDVTHNDGEMLAQINLINQTVAGVVDIDMNSKKKSSIKLDFQSTDLKSTFSTLSPHNALDDSVFGEVNANINASFFYNRIEHLDFDLMIKDFKLSKGEDKIVNKPNQSNIRIRDGNIIRWDVRLVGDQNHLLSQGIGSIPKGYTIDNKLSISTVFLELLTPQIQKSMGTVNGEAKISGISEQMSYNYKFDGDNLSFKVPPLPGNFEKLKFRVTGDEDLMVVQQVSGLYGKGELEMKGTIRPDFPAPELNISVSLNNSYVPLAPLFKKANIVTSGTGTITGTDLPYLVKGEFSISYGLINDELADISSKSSTASYAKYVPKEELYSTRSLFEFDVHAVTQRPISVKNTLVDLGLEGGIRITGQLERPLFNGQFNMGPGSKILFKGHEFILSRGEIILKNDKQNKEPIVNFSANALVNSYVVTIAASGEASKLNIDLRSEPYLSQTDVLSLLTLGITSDISKDLQESDRQAVTSAGIGSLLADQFKINKELNSSLGVNVSVEPEFEEDDSSLLRGRSNSGASNTSRLKSATKVRVKKQINKKTDISVSSLVGGSIRQKQEMNLNYNLSRNVSLQGVYELKSSNEDESAESPDSIGADIKFRWSFK